MKQYINAPNLLLALAAAAAANGYLLAAADLRLLFALIPLFLAAHLLPGVLGCRARSVRLRWCAHGGAELVVFLLSTVLSLPVHLVLAFYYLPADPHTWIRSAAVCFLVEASYFWNGILCVYATSYQLGIRIRVVGVLCGMIPVARLAVLCWILQTVMKEAAFETEKERIDRARAAERICATRYPILLVHGIFFRDHKYPNYWGRIPKSLRANGAQIYYGAQESACTVEESAHQLTLRIRAVLKESGAEKVNIIAHSKGGLDARFALAYCGAAPLTASLTTINTPHRGCLFADYLLGKVPLRVQRGIAAAYNFTARRLGDRMPDFMAAVQDMTASACIRRDREIQLPEGVFCQSYGSIVNKARGGRFPLNCFYHLARHFEGINDGLVAESSFRWSDRYILLRVPGNRGISHGDMIDLNRENIPDFDVREFYVQLVRGLKERGL